MSRISKTLLLGLMAATASFSPALAQGLATQPGNCAVYAEELSKTIKADKRVTGTAQSEAVETLGKYAAYLRKTIAADMDATYQQAAAFGMDKATVDARMKAGETAIRDGFTGPTMKPKTVYTDHLTTIVSCVENSAKAGKLSAADVQKMSARMNAVYMQIR